MFLFGDGMQKNRNIRKQDRKEKIRPRYKLNLELIYKTTTATYLFHLRESSYNRTESG